MKSLAIWYKPKGTGNTEHAPELELHINHWKLLSGNKKLPEYLLDIGIKVIKGDVVEDILIYLPQSYQDITPIVEDLGSKLEDKGLLTAIFNEKYDPRPIDSSKFFEVKKGDETKFAIYKIDVKSDITSECKFNGTVISIPFRQLGNNDTYYRIRLKSDIVKHFSSFYRPSYNFLESAYSSIELIDFRINDSRNLPLSLLEDIESKGKIFNISLIHLFIMRKMSDEYIMSDISLNSVRQLEEGTWHNYLNPEGYKYENTIAYQLKVKTSEDQRERGKFIEDYNALIKFRFEDSKLKKYLLYLFVLGMALELLGNYVYELLKR